MHKILICATAVAALGVAGCGYTPEQRAATGAGIGAGTGAVIAAAAGASPGVVIASSLLGAGTGAVIGANTRPPPPYPAYYVDAPPPGRRRCIEWGEDIYGRRFCAAFYGDRPSRYAY